MSAPSARGGSPDVASERMTMAQLAREAKVSVPTVSKVLNGRADVADDTRARVESVIRKHGYRPRHASTAVRARMVDLVFHQIESPWALELIRGVERAARQAGVVVVVSEIGIGRTPREEWVDSVLARRPLGVIVVMSALHEGQRAMLGARAIPYVVVDPLGDEEDDVPTVGATNWRGGLLATEHLLELGHRAIAVIGGPPETLSSRARVAGYVAALDGAGVRAEARYRRHGDFSVAAGYRHGLDLLAGPDRPTAVFAGSDLQALGVYRAARELGLDVPGDVSVVGYDDLPLAQWVSPALTTIDQPLAAMAEAATDLLLRLDEGHLPGRTRMELTVRLTVRGSTAPPG